MLLVGGAIEVLWGVTAHSDTVTRAAGAGQPIDMHHEYEYGTALTQA